MKSRFLALFVMILVAAAPALVAAPAAKTATEYIAEAQALANGGKLTEAIALLKQAAAEHPASSDVYAYLGLYTGQSAGQTGGNFMEAGRLTAEAFTLLDKAVALGPENATAYFYRGLMGVRVPVFLGKLAGGSRLELMRLLGVCLGIFCEESIPLVFALAPRLDLLAEDSQSLVWYEKCLCRIPV